MTRNRIFKTINPKQHWQGRRLDTKTYNYGISVRTLSDSDAQLYDHIFEQSARSGEPLEDLVADAHSRGLIQESEISQLSAQFREYLYERVRWAVAPTAPVRRDSIFACPDVDSVRRFRESHPRAGVDCELKIIELTAYFKADMSIIDQVEGTLSFNEAQKIIERYWRQECNSYPLFELLVQGRFKVGAAIH